MERSNKLNLGCGPQAPSGWINVDYALGARLMKLPGFRALNSKAKLFSLDWNAEIVLHDLTKTFPWADSSIDVVYSSHTLEHFSKDDGRRFLGECHRVLRRNGIIRIVVPDLRHKVMEYVEGRINAEDFLNSIGVLYTKGDSTLRNRLSPFLQFPHKCMYDKARLAAILDEIGFEASSRLAFDSSIEGIRDVELENRAQNAVIVEGHKR